MGKFISFENKVTNHSIFVVSLFILLKHQTFLHLSMLLLIA